jgi:hypothetical protein
MPGYDSWKTRSPDNDLGGTEEPSHEQQKADWEDELDQILELVHDRLVSGASGDEIKILAGEHPQFSEEIFAFVEAWFSSPIDG